MNNYWTRPAPVALVNLSAMTEKKRPLIYEVQISRSGTYSFAILEIVINMDIYKHMTFLKEIDKN